MHSVLPHDARVCAVSFVQKCPMGQGVLYSPSHLSHKAFRSPASASSTLRSTGVPWKKRLLVVDTHTRAKALIRACRSFETKPSAVTIWRTSVALKSLPVARQHSAGAVANTLGAAYLAALQPRRALQPGKAAARQGLINDRPGTDIHIGPNGNTDFLLRLGCNQSVAN